MRSQRVQGVWQFAPLSSLDSPGQSEIDEAWANEAEDRIAAFERDEIKAVNEDEAFAQLEKRFQ